MMRKIKPHVHLPVVMLQFLAYLTRIIKPDKAYNTTPQHQRYERKPAPYRHTPY